MNKIKRLFKRCDFPRCIKTGKYDYRNDEGKTLMLVCEKHNDFLEKLMNAVSEYDEKESQNTSGLPTSYILKTNDEIRRND